MSQPQNERREENPEKQGQPGAVVYHLVQPGFVRAGVWRVKFSEGEYVIASLAPDNPKVSEIGEVVAQKEQRSEKNAPAKPTIFRFQVEYFQG
jgi:hypothetical protein